MSDQDNSSEAAWHVGPLYGLPPLQQPSGVLPQLGESPTDASRALISDRLQAVRDDIERLTLSALWNATSPINRLPNEIFSEIFLTFTNPPDGGFLPLWSLRASKQRDGPCADARPFGWLPLALVCRHWWAVTRSTPQLWRTIEINEQRGRQDLLHLALQRSASATLDVTFYRAQEAVAAAPLLKSHAARLRKLTFPEADNAELPSLLSLLNDEMPTLNRLTIYGDLVPSSTHTNPTAAPPGYLPVLLPPSRFRSLTYLRLSWVVISAERPIPSTLRTLSLTGCTFEHAVPLSALLKSLEECRALEDLCLDGLPVNLDVGRTPSSVKLPSLKYLAISDDRASRIAHFLEPLHVPRIVTFSFSGQHNLPDPPRFSSLLPRRFKARFPTFTSVQSVDIHITSGHMEMSFGGGCSLKLDQGPGLAWEKRWTCLSELPAILDAPRLTRLSMRGDVSDAEEDHWRSLFEGLPFIERFELSCYGMVGSGDIQRLFTGLSSSSSGTPAVNPSQPVGISLRHITVHGGEWNDSIMDTLKSFLTSRMESHAPLHTLHLQFRFYNEAEFMAKKAIFLAEVAPRHSGGPLTFEAARGYTQIEGESELSGLSDEDEE
ncbi:hypothetical protein C8T65DRAFT_700487 [Cerioporus squamosus]|nr:hypothetical protein C8T65DRAFT_700487 [Cerioporus squamosus]